MAIADTPRGFPWPSVVGLLTLAAGLLFAAAWWGMPAVMPGAEQVRPAVVMAAVTVWAAALLGLAPMALVGNRGVVATVYAYFAGMSLRLIGTMGVAMFFVHGGRLPGRPVAVALAVFYLPLLALEVTIIGRYLWGRDSAAGPPGEPAGPRSGSTDPAGAGDAARSRRTEASA